MLKIAENFSELVSSKINSAKKGIQKWNEEKAKKENEKQEQKIQDFLHELREYHAAKKDSSVIKYNVQSFEYWLKHGKRYNWLDQRLEANRTKYSNTDYQSSTKDNFKQCERQAEEENFQKKLKDKQKEDKSWARLAEHFEQQEEYCAQRKAEQTGQSKVQGNERF